MSTYVETNRKTKGNGTDIRYLQRANTGTDISKRKWLRKYSRRLLRHWLQQQTPLGVASAYVGQIEEDLTEFYNEPLKRMFIETTY